jgi:hypothetical protein
MAKIMAKIKPNSENMVMGKSYSGTRSFNCGDEVAEALAGLTPDDLTEVAIRSGIDHTKYGSLNPGHRRMVIGAALRKRVRDMDNLHEKAPDDVISGSAWLAKIVGPRKKDT